jgi:hypothetical protein
VTTEPDVPGQYLIVVDAFRGAGTFTQVIDELYTLRDGFKPEDGKREVSTPEIRRQAMLSVVTTKEEPDPNEPKPGSNDVDPVIPEGQDKDLERWLRSHPESQPAKPGQNPRGDRLS